MFYLTALVCEVSNYDQTAIKNVSSFFKFIKCKHKTRFLDNGADVNF